jgi:hypothetical protein
MDKELISKLKAEQPLTAEESLRLDTALDSTDLARRAVSELPDEAPSLAWRSGLNERLVAVSRKRLTHVYWRFGLSAAVCGAATLFVLTVFLKPIGQPQDDGGQVRVAKEKTVEDAILSEHQDALGEMSLGVHVTFDESGS